MANLSETSDVYISGIDSSIEAWSTETTQRTIAASLRQANADTTGMVRLLELLGAKAGISEKEMTNISVEIAKANAAARAGATKVIATATKSGAEETKQTGQLTSLLAAFSGTTSQLTKNARDQAKRDSIRDDLIEAGMSSRAANEAADNRMNIENAKAAAAKVAAFVGIASTFTMTAAETIRTGYGERADMVGEMRQSGLLSGLKEANQGFISIAKTISATNFTFGEAAEFTKRFSQAVGVTGVKSALDFSNSMAKGSIETGTGYMERFSMSFGQVANMSGQYLESLRASGQLSSRSDTQMKTGMSNFMDNVQMTANVLKISMEEAAELMMKSVSPVQVGLMATLEASQRERAESALLAMNVQGGPIGDALAARLAAGSEADFLLTDKYAELMSMGAVGMETLDFISPMAKSIESGEEVNWQAEFGKQYIQFADRLTEVGKDNRMMLLTNDNIAAVVGQVMASRENYDDAGVKITGGGDEDKTKMLADEQQRIALRLSEDALNTQMGNFTHKLKELTETLAQAAQMSYDWMEAHKEGIETAAEFGVWWKEIWPNLLTWTLDMTSDDTLASTTLRVEQREREYGEAKDYLDGGRNKKGNLFTDAERYQAIQVAGVAKRALESALDDQTKVKELTSIDDNNVTRIIEREASTAIIDAQIVDKTKIKDLSTTADFDTVAEVKAKLLLLEAELIKAKDLKDVDGEFWGRDGYWNETSSELRNQSGEYVTSINRLIKQFEKVLKVLKD